MNNTTNFLLPGHFYYARSVTGTFYYFELVSVDECSLTITKACYALQWFPDFLNPAPSDISVRWDPNTNILWPMATLVWAMEIPKLPS
jgi:hypothetical protein